MTADIDPHAFAIAATSVDTLSATVTGIDPTGGPLTVELLAADGASIERHVVRPRPQTGIKAVVNFDAPAAPGNRVRVAQDGGYAAHTAAFGSAGFTGDGFTVALPALPGVRGSYEWSLASRASLPRSAVTDALGPCRQLGTIDATSGADCAGIVPGTVRASVAATGEVPIGGDAISLATVQPSGDTTALTLRNVGEIGDLDSGVLSVRRTPAGVISAAVTVPRAAPLPALSLRRISRTDRFGVHAFAPPSDAFPGHLTSGTSVTMSGSGIGSTPVTYVYALVSSLAGTTLAGQTYANARVVFSRPLTLPIIATAGPDGSFAVPVPDLAVGDSVTILAIDPASHNATTRRIIAATAAPAIKGVVDRQLVRGVVTATAENATRFEGDAPRAGGSNEIDTTRFADGPLRLEAIGPGGIDYLYLLVDNTPPDGSAGPDQTLQPGRTMTFVTGARDANGIASVTASFGDGTNGTQPVQDLGKPLAHVYRRPGSFTATITITDVAGNATVDSALVRVQKSASSLLLGKLPLTLRRGSALRYRVATTLPGDLAIRVINVRGAVVTEVTINFSRPRAAKVITLGTQKLRPGNYLLARQFFDANGVASATSVTPLRVNRR